jgi:hypothetical protein
VSVGFVPQYFKETRGERAVSSFGSYLEVADGLTKNK